MRRAARVEPDPSLVREDDSTPAQRRGDRYGNGALWRNVVRMSSDPRTKTYVERRTKEGLTTAEIIRCLKRYVARETYDLLPRELLV